MMDSVTITVLVDNYAALGKHFYAEHGFCALVETPDRRIIFDTGQSGAVLRHNVTTARLRPTIATLDAVALSHGHYDHAGGLLALAELTHDGARNGQESDGAMLEVYAHPDCFDDKFSLHGERYHPIGIPFNRFELEDAHFRFNLHREPVQLARGVWTSGEVPRNRAFEPPSDRFFVRSELDDESYRYTQDALLDDGALFVHTDEGVVVVSGCSHSGIVNIVDHAMEFFGDERLRAVIGGMHLSSAPIARLESTFDALGQYPDAMLIPGHCTGIGAIAVGMARLGVDRVQNAYAGLELRFGSAVDD